jgi:hypothetical protein
MWYRREEVEAAVKEALKRRAGNMRTVKTQTLKVLTSNSRNASQSVYAA